MQPTCAGCWWGHFLHLYRMKGDPGQGTRGYCPGMEPSPLQQGVLAPHVPLPDDRSLGEPCTLCCWLQPVGFPTEPFLYPTPGGAVDSPHPSAWLLPAHRMRVVRQSPDLEYRPHFSWANSKLSWVECWGLPVGGWLHQAGWQGTLPCALFSLRLL